jgi:hypothetical protein
MLALAFFFTALGFYLLAAGHGTLGLVAIFAGTACVGAWGESTRQSPGSTYVKAEPDRRPPRR